MSGHDGQGWAVIRGWAARTLWQGRRGDTASGQGASDACKGCCHLLLFSSCSCVVDSSLLLLLPLCEPQQASGGDDAATSTSTCPVMHKSGTQAPGKVTNSYGEEVDPRNQMPEGNQAPWPGQKQALPTTRVASTIPKGLDRGGAARAADGHENGGDNGGPGDGAATWTYPSPQQFYNALRRKGKGDDVDEDQVNTLVSIHNNMNEVSWTQLLDWEQWHIDRGEVEGGVPQLSKFMGRPFGES